MNLKKRIELRKRHEEILKYNPNYFLMLGLGFLGSLSFFEKNSFMIVLILFFVFFFLYLFIISSQKYFKYHKKTTDLIEKL